MLCSALGAEAKVSNTEIDSCATLSAVVYTPASTSACQGESNELSATIYANVSAQWFKDGQPFGLPNTETVYAFESGVYHLEVTNALLQCNHSYDDIAVQINPLPVVYAGADVTVCEGDIWYFYASDDLEYSWSNVACNGCPSLISENQVVTLFGIDGNGCSNSDTLMVTVSPSAIYFFDGDGDGFGNQNFGYTLCSQPLGYVTNSSDCNDNDASINTNASDICNGVDDNCSGQIDEGFVFGNYYQDSDSDGYGNINIVINSCAQLGYVTNSSDCNDNNASININASEICNGLDENCNGQADDGLVFINYYLDLDLDGFGSLNTLENACVQPIGFVTNALDCNDASSYVNPDAIEICNGLDEDCNGENDNSVVFATFYEDADGDTYGDPTTGQDFCLIPNELFVANGNDCDDANAQVNPGVTEIWENGTDDDCNPITSDVGIAESTTLTLSLFPNPVADRITLTMSSSDVHAVELYNSLGQLIHASKIFGSQVSIDVSEFPKGYYVVRVNGLSKTFVKNN
jgi:hypothetical protein